MPEIFKQLKQIAASPQIALKVAVRAENTSAAVYRFFMRPEELPVPTVVLQATTPALSEEGQQWQNSHQELYEYLLRNFPHTQYVLNLDDDQLFSQKGLTELVNRVIIGGYDRCMFESFFFWDDKHHINTRFPRHNTANLFRVIPGDAYSTRFVAQCPEKANFSSNWLQMKNPLLNYGYMEPTDRRRSWEAAKLAGRIDAHTLCFALKPYLKEYHASDSQ